MGENLKKNGYAKLNHFAVCVNLTQCIVNQSDFFWAVLGLGCCAQTFSSCDDGGGYSLVEVLRLLTAVASLAAEREL